MFEAEHMQGLLLSGYGKQPSAAYAFFSIADPAKAKAWLKDVTPLVTPGKNFDKSRDFSLNIAFTHKGFARLGLGGGPEHELVVALGWLVAVGVVTQCVV